VAVIWGSCRSSANLAEYPGCSKRQAKSIRSVAPPNERPASAMPTSVSPWMAPRFTRKAGSDATTRSPCSSSSPARMPDSSKSIVPEFGTQSTSSVSSAT